MGKPRGSPDLCDQYPIDCKNEDLIRCPAFPCEGIENLGEPFLYMWNKEERDFESVEIQDYLRKLGWKDKPT